ncbi:winged helix-turn-helix domain-containing protein [Alishewanella longhuensis]
MSNTEVKYWRIGAVIFDCSRRELRCGEQRFYLEPKLFALLQLLLTSEQQQVSREQLIAEVWQGRVVGEGAINRVISLLRKGFASLDTTEHYIETLPKVGYRLAAKVCVLSALPDTGRNSARSRSYTLPILAGLLMVAVLLGWHATRASPNWLKIHSAPAAITHLAGAEFGISNSAEALLFHHLDTNNFSQLWLLADGQPTPLTQEPQQHRGGQLSHDGSQVVFAVYKENSCQIQHLNLRTNQQQALFACPADSAFQASWLADNSGFYYRQRRDKTQPYALYRYSIATGQQQQLTAPATDNLPGELLLAAAPFSLLADTSPRVAQLRYINQHHTELSLLQGPHWQATITQQLPFNVSHMLWVRDDLLLLSSDKMLYQYHLPSATLQPLYQATQSINSFAVRDQHLFIAEQQLNTTIWRYDNTSGITEPVVRGQGINSMPRVSLDEQQLLFLSNRSGHYQIWQQQSHNQPSMLSELPVSSTFTRLSLASDQQSMVFSQDGAVYQLTLPDGKLQQLLPSSAKANVVNLHNNSLIFSSDRSGDWQLWHYDLTSNALQQLTTNGGYSGIVHNNQLYYSRYHQPGLWQKNLVSGQEQLLLANFDIVNWLNWQLLNEAIYYFQPQSGIWRYPLTTGAAELLIPISHDFVHHFSVSEHGIYFVRRGQTQGDIHQLSLTD